MLRISARSGTVFASLAIGLTIAVAVIGMGFGLWVQQLGVFKTVDTGNVALDYTLAFSNDDGIVTDPDFDADDNDGMLQVFDYNGSSSSADPLAPGPTVTSTATSTARYDKDVGRCYAEVLGGESETGLITEDNVFPSYHCTVWFDIQNNGTVPVKVHKVTLNTSSTATNVDPSGGPLALDIDDGDLDASNSTGADLTVDVSDIALCQQVDPGSSVRFTVDQHVLEEAPPGDTLSYKVDVDVAQWNELGDQIDEIAETYETVMDILGPTGTILQFGQYFEGFNFCESAVVESSVFDGLSDPTFDTSGAFSSTFTWSEPPGDFDSPPGFQGLVPYVAFNGIDEEADSPDAAFWSRADGAFSVGAWVNLTDATTNSILAKYDAAGDTREWLLATSDDDRFRFQMFDESVVGNPDIRTDSITTITQGQWTFVVGTYDGTPNASGINIYEDGDLASSTDNDDPGFVSLEDLGGTMKLGHFDASPIWLMDGKMLGGPCGPFFVQTELTLAQVQSLYAVCKSTAGL